MEGHGDQEHITAHAVEPRQVEEPLVDQVGLRGEAVNGDEGGSRSVAVLPVPCPGDAVAAVLLPARAQLGIHGLEGALEGQLLGLAIPGAEARQPRSLAPHRHLGRWPEERVGVCGVGDGAVEVHVTTQLSEASGVVAERQGHAGQQGREQGSDGVVGGRGDLDGPHISAALQLEGLHVAPEVRREVIPPRALSTEKGSLAGAGVEQSGDDGFVGGHRGAPLRRPQATPCSDASRPSTGSRA